jgi:hypothetical protein
MRLDCSEASRHVVVKERTGDGDASACLSYVPLPLTTDGSAAQGFKICTVRLSWYRWRGQRRFLGLSD